MSLERTVKRCVLPSMHDPNERRIFHERNEATRVRSEETHGTVGKTYREPLRKQLWRRGEAPEPDSGVPAIARLRESAWVRDQRVEARRIDGDELDDPARDLFRGSRCFRAITRHVRCTVTRFRKR